MTRYRFSIGNNQFTTGVGMCFSIVAEDPVTAIAKAQSFVDGAGYGLPIACDGAADVAVYAGPDLKVTGLHIEDATEEGEPF